MRSEKQILASRANGLKSRGPVTSAGKAKAARNSLRHGLHAREPLPRPESCPRFDVVLKSFADEFQPTTSHTSLLVEKLARARWRQMYIWKLECDLIHETIARQDQSLAPQERVAAAYRHLLNHGRTLCILNRYEAAFDHLFHLALHPLLACGEKCSGTERTRESAAEPSLPSSSNPILWQFESTFGLMRQQPPHLSE